MNAPGPQHLGLAYLASEVLLTLTRRSRGSGQRQDRSTLRLLWLVVLGSVAAGLFVTWRWPAAALAHSDQWRFAGLILFLLGLALRWWSIITLGRFFTVDVQIERDHRLVDSGPFAVVRHPSYTGLLVAFLGFAFSLANWAAAVVLLVPIFIAFARRMNIEEEALTNALGDRYRSYMRRTKRLIPGVY
jgi:protein-S-isoprenylcysteine O-methyltransferase